MNSVEILRELEKTHKIGAKSGDIQKIILPKLAALGFSSEKKGLFSNYQASGLRPDYYASIGNSGILVEVERGKTTTNNMDILDLWKCHICMHAHFLFLIVPQFRQYSRGYDAPTFSAVVKRMEPFFLLENYVNVDACFIFWY